MSNVPEIPEDLRESERGPAWNLLYQLFGELPIPEKQGWKIAAMYLRLTQQLAEAQAAGLPADIEKQLAEAKATIQRLDWKPITPESLPKMADEAIGEHLRVIPNPYYPNVVSVTDWHERNLYTADRWQERGFTHYRPINPPTVAKETE